jgi:putative copper export protein
MLDFFFIWKVLILWIHVITASIWLGGLILTTIINRQSRKKIGSDEAYKIVRSIGIAFQRQMRDSLYLAIVTGILNVLNDTYYNFNFIFSMNFLYSSFGQMVLIKSIVAILVLVFAIYHTNIARSIPNFKDEGIVKRLRRKISIIGWLAMILTFILFLIGSFLVFIV